MEILIDASAGCCPGVVKAIRKAEQAIGEGRPLLSLGQIVHNEREAERLQKQGMRTVLHVDEGDAAGYMLIRAHGEPPSTYAALDAGKRPYIDATCPVVLRLQRKVGEAALRMEKSGGYVLLFAKSGHPEATGLMGHTRGLGRIVSLEDLPMDTLHHPLEIFAQTTMDPEAYEAFLHRILQERDRLRAPSAELHIHRTICGFVANRKESLTRFASSVDLLLFLTGKESSNGKYLFSLALKANAAAHALGGPDELQPEWFRGVRRLGISGATSTPVWQMEELARVIREHYASIEF